MDPKAQNIEGLLRSFGVAAKTLALFPLPHPVTDRAVADFLAKLQQYTAAYGPFAARVARHELWVGTLSFKDGAFGSLASLLYTRKVAKFFVMPTVKTEDVVAFLSIIGRDRGQIETAGGAAHLLWQQGVESIQVVERAFQFQGTSDGGPSLTVPNVTGARRLSPDERERVLDALRQDPTQAHALLDELRKNATAAAAAAVDAPVEAQVEPVFQIVKGLDRLILDEPVEDQDALYANLAEAQLLLPEPLRGLLLRALFSRARDDDSARVLFQHLPNDRVADVLATMLSARSPIAEQVEATFPLTIDPEKTKAVVLALEARLAVAGQPIGGLASAVMARLPAPKAPAPRPPRHVEFDDIQVELGPDETASALKEAQAMDEPSVIEEVARTLIDVIRGEDDERELDDAGGTLEEHLRWLIDHKRFAAVGDLLRALRSMTAPPKTVRSKIAADMLDALARGPLLAALLATLWERRHTISDDQMYPCLQVVSAELVEPLVGTLGEEQRAGMRALLCDLIVLLCGDRVDAIGRHASDPRWYLARNIAGILGRLEDPRVLPYLSRLLHHDEYRVRREAVDALARLSPDQAQTILAGCLDDADPRVRLRVLSSLTAVGVRQALPQIAALLERRDPFNREFEMKRAALEALQCYGTDDAIPTLRRLAGRRLVVGWRGRELRRLAAVAATTLSGEGPQQVDPMGMALRREAGRL
jgi:hypothetical protein